MHDKFSKERIIAYGIGGVLVIWLALLIAPKIDHGLFGLLEHLSEIFRHPFHIEFCKDSLRTVLLFLLIYAFSLCVYLSSDQNYRRGAEYGSARWGVPSALNRKYADKEERRNIILTKNVRIGLDGRKHYRNLNILVIGGSGAGKSRTYAIPNLLNACTSYFVLDPKGELVRETASFLEQQGYIVRVLDLINMEKSHGYNPFAYLHSETDIQRLATNLFRSTTPKNSHSSEPFWENAAMEFLLALMFYLYYEAPPEEQNFAMIMDMIRAGDVHEDNDYYRSPLDILFDRLEMRDPTHIAVKYYRGYHTGAAKTLKSIQTTLVTHLDKFNLDSLAKLTTKDEMELTMIGERKTAIYAIIPDNDSSFNFLIGTMYTQMFQQMYYQADFVHHGRLPVHVHCIMDEFPNVPLPDDFDKLLATMRSREISVSIIIQNMAQLKALYEKQWQSIQGNCDSFLFLGSNESDSSESVSKLLGKETLHTNTYGRTRGRNGSYSKNDQLIGRELLDPAEVRMLNNSNALLFIRGERPVLDLKYPFQEHPNYSMTESGGGISFTYGEDNHSFASLSIRMKSVAQAKTDAIKEDEYFFFSDEELEELLQQENEKRSKQSSN